MDIPTRFEDLEEDLLERIVGLLSVRDVCALSTCSKFLWGLCSRNEIWQHLFMQRWPVLIQETNTDDNSIRKTETRDHAEFNPPCSHKGWKTAYAHVHFEMASRARAVIEFVKMCACEESLEVANYLKAMELLSMRNIGFEDVLTNLLSPSLSVLVNLIGLHYLLFHLRVQDDAVKRALINSHISDRHICLRWWSLGGWSSNGFRRRDEMHVKIGSLYELTDPEQHFLFKVMERGIVHEVLRVQISADFKTSAWVWRDMHSQR